MIDVQTPNGATVSFPDGTPNTEISSVLAKHFGGPDVSRETSPGIAEGTARAAATGVPIVGGVLNKLDAATNALLAPLMDQYLPDSMDKLPEDSFGDRYSHALKIQDAKDKSFGAAHPVLDTAAQVAGGLGAGGALLKAAPVAGARMLGLAGETLPAQVVQGAASGTAIGMADSAIRGEDPTTGGEIGALTGAAGPVVGRAIGKVVQGARNLREPAPIPANTTDIAGVPVRKSVGQATGDTEAITKEQMALRGADNSREQAVARDYFDAQRGELGQARDAVAARMDPGGAVHAANPQEAASILSDSLAQRAQTATQTEQAGAQRLAGDRDALAAQLGGGRALAASPLEAANIVSGAVGNAAERAQAATAQAYGALRELPGKFHPAAFNGVGDEIAAALNRGAEPIRVNPQTTPQAANAVRDLDELLSGITQQRDPATGRIVAKPPVTAQVVEDARKRLNSFYGDALQGARSGGNWSDVRAMRGVMREFDDAVVGRLTDGRFVGGDPAQVAATMRWARGLHADYRKTFTPQGAGDSVGRDIQKIVGRYEGQAATPEDLASMLYGTGGRSTQIAQRLVGMFGAESEPIGAIKQGALAHLTERPGGLGPFDPEKAADRIDTFLKGSTAQVYFNPADRAAMSDHAAKLRASVAKPLSDTENIVARIASGQMNPTDVVRLLNTTKGGGRPEAVINHVKTAFGPDSREFAALRQGQWHYLTEMPPNAPLDVGSRATVKRLTDFLDNVPLSHAMYDADHRELIGAYRDLLARITPPPGTVNYSNTASVLGKMFRGALDGLFGTVPGFHLGGPFGAAVGTMAADKVRGVMLDVVRASKVARSLYGTPGSMAADQRLGQSLARLSSFTARTTTPALTH